MADNDDEPKPGTERRRNGGRRKLDKEMMQNIESLQKEQKLMNAALSRHLTDCSENYATMKASLDSVLGWVRPQIQKAEARALVWKKVSEAVLTDAMTWALKIVLLIAVVAIASAVIPAARLVIKSLLPGSP